MQNRSKISCIGYVYARYRALQTLSGALHPVLVHKSEREWLYHTYPLWNQRKEGILMYTVVQVAKIGQKSPKITKMLIQGQCGL